MQSICKVAVFLANNFEGFVDTTLILLRSLYLKILFILPQLPYPLITGVGIKCHSILYAASLKHSCDVVSLGGEDIMLSEGLLHKYVPKAKLRACFPAKKGWRLVLARLISILKSEPIFFARFSSAKVRSSVRNIMNEKYDLIFIESFALSNYREAIIDTPCIISVTDAPSITYSHATEESNSFLFGLYRQYQLVLVRQAELALFSGYAGIHVVSDYDRKYLLREYKGLEVFSISHIVPEEVKNRFISSASLIKKTDHKTNILYSGRCSSDTLLNTLLDFVNKVFTPLIQLKSNVQLTILSGEGSKKVIDNLPNDDSIIVKEWVENYELELLNSDVIVFPDKYKSGVKTRLLYALASGKPIVATPEAIFGLPVYDGEHLLVRELGSKFSAAIQSLLNDEELSKYLSENALKLIQGELSVDVHNHKWNRVFKKYSLG